MRIEPTRSTRESTPGRPWMAGLLLATTLTMMNGCAPSQSSNTPGSPARASRQSSSASPLAYPATAKTNHVDTYHGVEVADPYRWLEDDNAPETKAWVEAQNKVTFAYFASIPEREPIKRRLTKLWNYERYGIPFKEGGRYFITRNDGLQNQGVLYTMDTLTAAPRVLLDPNLLSKDGTVALGAYAISDDAKLMAYALSAAGSDWQEIRIRRVDTGQDLEDRLRWIKFSGISWRKDLQGFFYSRYAEPKEGDQLKGVNYFQKLYFHSVGTPQAQDVLVYERNDHKNWGFGGAVTDDGQYLIVNVWEGTDTRNRVFYKDPRQLEGPMVELLNDFDASYDFIDNDGPVFWFKTDLDAPRGRIIAIDTRQPQRSNWVQVVPQSAETLVDVSMVNDQFFCNYLKDAHSQVRILSREGKLVREAALPGIGTASGFRGKRADRETFYAYTGYTVPGTIYRYDAAAGQASLYKAPVVDFQSSDYETKQVFAQSKDGAKVPIFITHKKGLKLDGRNPTLLYGYGGFNISQTPAFSVAFLQWMEMGGVFAVANLRGGGEYGEAWHQAGMKLKKQNVFDDFIAASEWLEAHQYASPQTLAIMGGSNGGLLVGACLTQRPALYAAALPAVGVMDMLRFHKFTIGWAWTSEYGSSDDAAEFKALQAYSPLHQLRPGVQYPATLVTTADHDDRVVPAHSFKFAARLQEVQAGRSPTLIRIETKAGHGAGKPTAKLIEEAADRWAFLVRELRMRPYLPGEP